MRRWPWIVLAACVAALAVWLLFIRDSDEQAVRRAINRAADAVKVIPGESTIMRVARVRSELVEVIAKDVALTIPELEGGVSKGRDPLIATAIAAGGYAQGDLAIVVTRVQVDRDTASADVTATVSNGSQRDLRRASLRLLKRESAWRITEITVNPREPRE